MFASGMRTQWEEGHLSFLYWETALMHRGASVIFYECRGEVLVVLNVNVYSVFCSRIAASDLLRNFLLSPDDSS